MREMINAEFLGVFESPVLMTWQTNMLCLGDLMTLPRHCTYRFKLQQQQIFICTLKIFVLQKVISDNKKYITSTTALDS